MNMFKPTRAKSVDEYIKMLTPDRRRLILALDKLIKSTNKTLRPHFAYNMLGYGSFKYLDYKKREIDWPIIALASQKNYISLYVCAIDDGEYLAEKYGDRLGRVNVGRSCIRFKRLEDLNLNEVEKLIKKAAAHPGLV